MTDLLKLNRKSLLRLTICVITTASLGFALGCEIEDDLFDVTLEAETAKPDVEPEGEEEPDTEPKNTQGDEQSPTKEKDTGDPTSTTLTCDNSQCDDPPASTCDGDFAVAFVSTGMCDDSADLPKCTYPEESRTDCSELMQICLGGDCLDAPAPNEGELLITELMINPSAVSDSAGEWMELHNASDHTFDLIGLLIEDDTEELFEIHEAFLVPPGGYVVLGKKIDKEINGGVDIDMVYSGIGFTNTTDSVYIRMSEVTLDGLMWEAKSLFATTSGASVQRDLARDTWCVSETPWAEDESGDLGSPVGENHSCPMEEPII